MNELVIGTRRRSTSRGRGLMTMLALLLVAVVVAILIFRRLVSYPRPNLDLPGGAITFVDGGAEVPGGALAYRGRIAVLSLTGDPATLGWAHGRLLEGAVLRAHRRDAAALDRIAAGDGWFGATLANLRKQWRLRLVDDGIPGHQLVELAAMAQGAGDPDLYQDRVAEQAIFDIGVAGPASLGASERNLARSLSAVVPIHDAAGERLLVARTFASPGIPTPGRPPTLQILRSPDTLPIAIIGQAGGIGSLTGVNGSGIAIFVHPARSADTAPLGQPAALIAREVLEQAKTLDEAAKTIASAEILGAASFLIVDGKARRFATIERSPSHHFRDDERAVVDGLLTGKPFDDDPENDRARRGHATAARRDRAREVFGRASSVADVVAGLRDRRGPSGTLLPTGHRAAIDDPLAEQVVILDPSAMIVWIGEGPGSRGPLRAFDLRHLLGETPVATAPDDIPAADSEDATAIIEAAPMLEAALQRAEAGNTDEAAELAELAVARAPSWPQGRLVAHELAYQAGRAEAAARHAEAFLAAPDSPRAEEQLSAARER